MLKVYIYIIYIYIYMYVYVYTKAACGCWMPEQLYSFLFAGLFGRELRRYPRAKAAKRPDQSPSLQKFIWISSPKSAWWDPSPKGPSAQYLRLLVPKPLKAWLLGTDTLGYLARLDNFPEV